MAHTQNTLRPQGQTVARLVRALSAGVVEDDAAVSTAVGAAVGAAASGGVQTFVRTSSRREPRPDQADLPLPLDPPRAPCHMVHCYFGTAKTVAKQLWGFAEIGSLSSTPYYRCQNRPPWPRPRAL